MLIALLKSRDELVSRILTDAGVTLRSVRQAVEAALPPSQIQTAGMDVLSAGVEWITLPAGWSVSTRDNFKPDEPIEVPAK